MVSTGCEAASGQNMTAYLNAQMETGNMTDIYCSSVFEQGVGDKLMDLSGYAFMDNYVESRLREVMDNGAIYFVPTFYN